MATRRRACPRFSLAVVLALASWSATALLTDHISVEADDVAIPSVPNGEESDEYRFLRALRTTREVAIPQDHIAFKKKWLRMLEDDMGVNGSFPRSPKRGQKGYKVALGVFSTMYRKDIRQILRDTWMQHPDVCTIDKVTPECTIRVAFVIGRFNVKTPSSLDLTTNSLGMYVLKDEPDVVFLNVHDDINRGKTWNWFHEATQHIKWADFIMKADDDVFPHVTNIIDGLPDGSSCPQSYLGKVWTCKKWDICPRAECGPPVGHNYTFYLGDNDTEHDFTRECWVYMQGGLYGFSRPLVANITEYGGYWQKNKEGYEDLVTGRAVNEYARRTGTCVHVWDNKDIYKDRMYFHQRGGSVKPMKVSPAWDEYYYWGRRA